jgi:hypothetical protein
MVSRERVEPLPVQTAITVTKLSVKRAGCRVGSVPGKTFDQNVQDHGTLPFFVTRDDIFCYFLLKSSNPEDFIFVYIIPAKPYVSAA